MGTQARSTFTVQRWDEKTFTEGEDALKLTHSDVAKTFSGDLEGNGILRYLMFYGPNERTRVVGLERVCARLGGRSGSFVLEHDGEDDGQQARATLTVLPGSGTGDLAGLRGRGEMRATRTGEFTMTLEYEIDSGKQR